MPYVLRNRITNKYVTNSYKGDDANIANARLFSRKNAATGCSNFSEGIHDVVPMKLVEDTVEGLFRKKHRYMTFQEYQDDFGGDYYRIGDQPTDWEARGQTVGDYPPHLTETFIETTPGNVSQVIVFANATYGPLGALVQVYPQKKP